MLVGAWAPPWEGKWWLPYRSADGREVMWTGGCGRWPVLGVLKTPALPYSHCTGQIPYIKREGLLRRPEGMGRGIIDLLEEGDVFCAFQRGLDPIF